MTEEKGMIFNISDVDSAKFIVSHWLLNDADSVTAVAETPEWKEQREMIARVTVNGVELPFKTFDDWLMGCYEQAINSARSEFSELDAEVNRRLEKKLKAEAESVINKMHDLMRSMEDVESVLTPHWEKPNHKVFVIEYKYNDEPVKTVLFDGDLINEAQAFCQKVKEKGGAVNIRNREVHLP